MNEIGERLNDCCLFSHYAVYDGPIDPTAIDNESAFVSPAREIRIVNSHQRRVSLSSEFSFSQLFTSNEASIRHRITISVAFNFAPLGLLIFSLSCLLLSHHKNENNLAEFTALSATRNTFLHFYFISAIKRAINEEKHFESQL
jgi:hypothetical protein